MLHEHLAALFIHDLEKLKQELLLFKNENELWQTKGETKNAPGNLALHLIGNLKHFIGAQLGNTGYVREREKEFSEKNVALSNIIREIDEVKQMVNAVLSSLSASDLEKNFPLEFQGKQRSVLEMVFILYGHLNYHIGQINYQRRLLR